MLHAFVMLAAFVVITACAAIAFVIWLVTNIASLIQRLIAGPPKVHDQPVQGGQLCAVPNCRSINPVDAHFCRRCGHAFAAPVMILPPPRHMMRRRRRMHRLEMLREML